MAAYGRPDVAQTILRFALSRLPQRFTTWRAGELLVAHADLYRLARDRSFLTPRRRASRDSSRRSPAQLADSRNGLLAREPFSSDVSREVYALHGQAVVWQGLASLGRVWSVTGHPQLAALCRCWPRACARGSMPRWRSSERRAADGSVFVPAALLAGERPYPSLALSRRGHLLEPRDAVRAGLGPAFRRTAGRRRRAALSARPRRTPARPGSRGGDAASTGNYPPAPTSGIDQVYGVNVDRFLADADQPGPARPLALRHARRRDDARHLRRGGERERDPDARTCSTARCTSRRTAERTPRSSRTCGCCSCTRRVDRRARRVGSSSRSRRRGSGSPTARRSASSRRPTSFGRCRSRWHGSGSTVAGHIEAPAPAAAGVARLRLRLPAGEHLGAVRINGGRRRRTPDRHDRPLRAGPGSSSWRPSFGELRCSPSGRGSSVGRAHG